MARKPAHATRVRKLLYRIPDERKEEATKLVEDILFIQDKLEAIKPTIGSTNVVITYNNGGGQSGIRENPAIIGYQKLLRTYLIALDTLDKMREPDRAEDALIGVLDW